VAWTKRKIIGSGVGAIAILVGAAIGVILLVRPIAITEAFFTHNHCMKTLDGALEQYALENGGRFPTHTNGYGDALLLLHKYQAFLSGPGFSETVFDRAAADGTNVPEEKCGRVYVQGLSKKSNPAIAIVFDKRASPGDHLHGFRRLWAPMGRDVLYVESHPDYGWFVEESDWEEFARKQIELLVADGMRRDVAEEFYAATRVKR
jgi:hypothetical protein